MSSSILSFPTPYILFLYSSIYLPLSSSILHPSVPFLPLSSLPRLQNQTKQLYHVFLLYLRLFLLLHLFLCFAVYVLLSLKVFHCTLMFLSFDVTFRLPSLCSAVYILFPFNSLQYPLLCSSFYVTSPFRSLCSVGYVLLLKFLLCSFVLMLLHLLCPLCSPVYVTS